MAGRRLDLASGAVLLGFALALWFWLIPVYGGSGEQLLLPRLVALLVGGLALLLVIATLARPGGASGPSAAANHDPFIEVGGVYCLALDLFGFYLGGASALPLSFLLLGVRRWTTIAGWTAGTLVALYAIFEIGFRLPLPRGAIERMVLGG